MRRHRADRRRARCSISAACRCAPARRSSTRCCYLARAARRDRRASSSTTCIPRRSSWATAAACCSAFSFAGVDADARIARRRGPVATSCPSSPAPVLVLLIPIFDTTLVTVVAPAVGPVRRRRAAAITRRTGWSRSACRSARRWRVLWLLAAAGGAIGVALGSFDRRWWSLVGRAVPGRDGVFAVYLARHPRLRESDAPRCERGGLTPIVVDFIYKRRVAEVLLDFCLVTIVLLRRLPAAVRLHRVRRELQVLPRVAAGRARRADDCVLRRRRLPGRVAPLRHDGRGDVVKGAVAGTIAVRARDPLRLPVPELLADGVRHLRVILRADDRRVARVVPPHRRGAAAPAPDAAAGW